MSETRRRTPGPWIVFDDEIVAERGDVHIAQVVLCDDTNPTERQANMRLIAAAPDLLACLRRMCGMYGAYSKRLAPLLAEDEGTIWTFERANSLALEAIAKAEGRAASPRFGGGVSAFRWGHLA